MTVEQRRRKIVRVLEGDDDFVELKNCIDNCRDGDCRECGDLCPVKAANWVKGYVPRIAALLVEVDSKHLFHVRHTREEWARGNGELASPGLSLYEKQRRRAEGGAVYAGLGGVTKSIRRGLDSLNDPRMVAIGAIDAWRGYDRWLVGGSLIVAGVERSIIYDVLPGGGLLIEPVTDLRKTLRAWFARSRVPKLMPPFDAVLKLSVKQRSEYLGWLAGMEPNQRLFRYGCDRYFNRLPKVRRITRPKVRKPRPYPRQLIPYMFGNHPHNCQCRACGGLGKYGRPA